MIISPRSRKEPPIRRRKEMAYVKLYALPRYLQIIEQLMYLLIMICS